MAGQAFIGFLFVVGTLSVLMWGIVEILHMQGAIGWVLQWWQAVVMTVALIAGGALLQAVKVKR